jgi:hypothetical protein
VSEHALQQLSVNQSSSPYQPDWHVNFNNQACVQVDHWNDPEIETIIHNCPYYAMHKQIQPVFVSKDGTNQGFRGDYMPS